MAATIQDKKGAEAEMAVLKEQAKDLAAVKEALRDLQQMKGEIEQAYQNVR